MSFYKSLARPLVFCLDAETAHHLAFGVLNGLKQTGAAGWFGGRSQAFSAPAKVMGLSFRNPVGLAAGFDKDGLLGDLWADLGFGFAEFGTVTPRPQPGNPRPRLFRLVNDQAIINRMGFNNAGAQALARRLGQMHRRDLVVGINIGKNKDTPLEHAPADYLACLRVLHTQGDYFVVNVSSPNTPGLRQLQARDKLAAILEGVQHFNQGQPQPKPLVLKIAPDLTQAQLAEAAETAIDAGFAGLIATNTTIGREELATQPARLEAIGEGGLSGAPLTRRAQETLAFLHAHTDGKIALIGAGGIGSPADALARKAAGAALIQIYTAYVYEGPALVRRLVNAWRENQAQ